MRLSVSLKQNHISWKFTASFELWLLALVIAVTHSGCKNQLSQCRCEKNKKVDQPYLKISFSTFLRIFCFVAYSHVQSVGLTFHEQLLFTSGMSLLHLHSISNTSVKLSNNSLFGFLPIDVEPSKPRLFLKILLFNPWHI